MFSISETRTLLPLGSMLEPLNAASVLMKLNELLPISV